MQNSTSKRTTSALISRPQSSAAPTSSLGSSVNGALIGMGYPLQQSWLAPGPPPNGHSAQGYPYLPQLPFFAASNQQFSPNSSQHPPPHPPHPYPIPQYTSAYPPTNYFTQSNIPLQQPQHHSTPISFCPPRTTAEGYGISPAYVESSVAERNGPTDRPSRGRSGPNRGRGKPTSTGPSYRSDVALAPIVHTTLVTQCQLEDCPFEGPGKLVREHEEDRHLIFAPGREPKPWVPSFKGSTRIEGSNISLDSPEAIAKWIEDRKKRWPSSKVVEGKEKQRLERVAAGLESEFPLRGGRGRARGRGERGGRGRAGRPVGLAHNLGRPRDDDDDDGERPAKRVQKVEDISSSGQESDSDDGPPLASTSKLIVVDDFVATKSVGLQIHPSRLATATREAVGEGDLSSTQTVQVVCRHWRKGNCATGKECPFLHELPTRTGPASLPVRCRPAPPTVPYNPFARADPFSQLAERDISHLTAGLLQVIDFLSRNQWLRGVELRAGMVEDGVGSIGIIEVAPQVVEELDDSNVGGEQEEEEEIRNHYEKSDGSSEVDLDEDEDAAEDAAIIEALTMRIASASDKVAED